MIANGRVWAFEESAMLLNERNERRGWEIQYSLITSFMDTPQWCYLIYLPLLPQVAFRALEDYESYELGYYLITDMEFV